MVEADRRAAPKFRAIDGGREVGSPGAMPIKRKYRCTVCEHIYDPAEGDPAAGVAPGTAFEDLPDDWMCPDCGASKADFEPME